MPEIDSLLEKIAPRATDRLMERTMFAAQRSRHPHGSPDALFSHPAREGEERGGHDGHVMGSSASTAASLHPAVTALGVAGLALGAWAAIRKGGNGAEAEEE